MTLHGAGSVEGFYSSSGISGMQECGGSFICGGDLNAVEQLRLPVPSS